VVQPQLSERVIDQFEAQVRANIDQRLAIDPHCIGGQRADQVPSGAELVEVRCAELGASHLDQPPHVPGCLARMLQKPGIVARQVPRDPALEEEVCGV